MLYCAPLGRGRHEEEWGAAQVRSSTNMLCSGNVFIDKKEKKSFCLISVVGEELIYDLA